jgi:hypothetical protein
VHNFCEPKSGPTGINARARGDESAPEQGRNQTNQPTWKTLARRKHSPMTILWAQVQTSHRQREFPSFLARGSSEALPTLHLHRAPLFTLRLRAFSINWRRGTHGWTTTRLFNVHHSSAAGGGTNPAAEAVEEESSFGRPAPYVHSASEEFNLIS